MPGEKWWVILIEPGCNPQLKVPCPTLEEVKAFVREARIWRAFDTLIVVLHLTPETGLHVQSDTEFLWMEKPRKKIRRRLTSIKRAGGERTAVKLSKRLVRIWSDEHRAYWRAGGSGYTDGRKDAAWVLPFDQALAEVGHCCPRKRIVFEVAA